MFCPECGSEYREGFFECADCEVALVADPPARSEVAVEHPELLTVLATGDAGVVAVAESLLMDAGIPYLKKGDAIQDLFALGRFGSGFNPVTGPVIIQVTEDHAPAAAELLQDLREGHLEPPADEE